MFLDDQDLTIKSQRLVHVFLPFGACIPSGPACSEQDVHPRERQFFNLMREIASAQTGSSTWAAMSYLHSPVAELTTNCGTGDFWCCRVDPRQQEPQPACCFSQATAHLAAALGFMDPEYLDAILDHDLIGQHLHSAWTIMNHAIGGDHNNRTRWLDVLTAPNQWPIYYLLRSLSFPPIKSVKLRNGLHMMGVAERPPFLNNDRLVHLTSPECRK